MVMTTLYVMCSLTKSCDIDKKLHEIKDFSPDNLQQCTVCKYDLFWDGHGEVATVLLCLHDFLHHFSLSELGSDSTRRSDASVTNGFLIKVQYFKLPFS